MGGLEGVFPPPRVATAGVGPQPAEVVFARGATLDQHLPARVEDEDGECPVKLAAVFVRGELRGETDGVVVLVDEDQFVGFGGRDVGHRTRLRWTTSRRGSGR